MKHDKKFLKKLKRNKKKKDLKRKIEEVRLYKKYKYFQLENSSNWKYYKEFNEICSKNFMHVGDIDSDIIGIVGQRVEKMCEKLGRDMSDKTVEAFKYAQDARQTYIAKWKDESRMIDYLFLSDPSVVGLYSGFFVEDFDGFEDADMELNSTPKIKKIYKQLKAQFAEQQDDKEIKNITEQHIIDVLASMCHNLNLATLDNVEAMTKIIEDDEPGLKASDLKADVNEPLEGVIQDVT